MCARENIFVVVDISCVALYMCYRVCWWHVIQDGRCVEAICNLCHAISLLDAQGLDMT